MFQKMAKKESLHLGQKVYFGENRVEAVVDALTQTTIGLVVGAGYIIGDYKDVYAED